MIIWGSVPARAIHLAKSGMRLDPLSSSRSGPCQNHITCVKRGFDLHARQLTLRKSRSLQGSVLRVVSWSLHRHFDGHQGHRSGENVPEGRLERGGATLGMAAVQGERDLREWIWRCNNVPWLIRTMRMRWDADPTPSRGTCSSAVVCLSGVCLCS